MCKNQCSLTINVSLTILDLLQCLMCEKYAILCVFCDLTLCHHFVAAHRKQNKKDLYVNPEDIPLHSHENSRDYNFRVQDRLPRSKGSSGAPWQDCRILKKWNERSAIKGMIERWKSVSSHGIV